MEFTVTSTKHGDHEGLSGREAADLIFGGQLIQVQISWADQFAAMKPGETKTLRDGLDNVTTVERTDGMKEIKDEAPEEEREDRHTACGRLVVVRDGVRVCPRCEVENPR